MEATAAARYFEGALMRLRELNDRESPNIEAAADLCADRIAKGGLIFLFGSGHSRFLCDEMAPRQGALVGFVPMAHTALSTYADVVGPNGLRPVLYLERFEGYAEQILKGYQFGPHDAFIVISTSGIRPVIVEMAQNVRRRGLPVIGIVSAEHCSQAEPAHSSGQKLIDVVDILIDNHCPVGDCILELDGLDWRTGPLSTVTGAMIINMIRCRTAELLLERGHHPTMLPSHQFASDHGAEEQLDRYYTEYRRALSRVYAA